MCSLCICSRSTFFPYFFCCTILIMNARKRERKHITMFCLLQLSFTKWQETKSERERERDKPVDSEKINRKRHVRFFFFLVAYVQFKMDSFTSASYYKHPSLLQSKPLPPFSSLFKVYVHQIYVVHTKPNDNISIFS